MTFVDTNVFMYAVGGPHPLHAYLPVHRTETLDAALALVDGCIGTTWPLEPEDVLMARALARRHPGLGARDLIHVACCTRRGVDTVKSYDRALLTPPPPAKAPAAPPP